MKIHGRGRTATLRVETERILKGFRSDGAHEHAGVFISDERTVSQMTLHTLFHLVLIKPSHYDDDGDVLQWAHATTPSNTSRVTGSRSNSSSRGARRRHRDPTACARRNDQPSPRRPLDPDNKGRRRPRMVALCGVKRTSTLALWTSGPGSMRPASKHASAAFTSRFGGDAARGEEGIAAAAGDGRGHLAVRRGSRRAVGVLLGDAMKREMKPLYNYVAVTPALGGVPQPFLPTESVNAPEAERRLDAGRGCPFLCSFCTIINVHGRTSRFRSPDDVERIIRPTWRKASQAF